MLRPSLVLALVAVSGCIADLGAPLDADDAIDADGTDDLDDGEDELGTARDDLAPLVPSTDDDAVVIEAALPGALTCGESVTATVTVENRGALTWTRDTHKLGAVDDSDPLFDTDPRVYLDADVPPGGRVTFAFTLLAPAGFDGLVTTDWQMVHEGVTWFGDIASASVAVACDLATLPDRREIVDAVAAERPDLLAASCVADGGNNEFLHLVVDRLRLEDTRWGYNWKRGNVGDLSQDVVDYHFGAGDPEGSPDVFIVDIIGNHCPDSGASQPAWTDVTQATIDGGTIGRWTSLDRF